MQNTGRCGKLVTVKDGFARCPWCGAKLVKVAPETEASSLPVWCRRCKRELIINIDGGQSYLSPSPDPK